MDERQIIKALRRRDPQGIAEVYDRYAEGLYEYCWWLLRDHGTAREALHDSLLATGVHVDALRSPERLRPWLYALVRTECLRRSPATPRTADADDTAPDSTELRSLAWQAIDAVPAAESEILELHVRHGIEGADLATILRRPAGEVAGLLESARTRVGQALRAEMLARSGPASCTQVVELLQGAGERHRAERDERVDRHARDCPTCSERIPRRVSISRLMGLLPPVELPADLRSRVIDAYTEPRLLDYRLLAARRLQPLGRDGFPSPRRQSRRASGGTAALAAVGGLVAASLCAAAGVAVLRYAPIATDARAGTAQMGRDAYREVGVAPGPPFVTSTGAGGAATGPTSGMPGGGSPEAGPPDTGAPGRWLPRYLGSVPPGTPLGARSRGGSADDSGTAGTPPSAPTSSAGQLQVSAGHVDLGEGNEGTVELRARGGTAHWSATPSTSCLGASPSAGGMDAGKRVTVSLTVDRDSRGCAGSGAGRISFAGDGPSVRVSWSDARDGSPTPTGSETGSPVPSPSQTRSTEPADTGR